MVSNVTWQPPEGMEEYLKPTELVDLNSEIIIETTNRVIKEAKTPREAAIKIFYFVRDEIKFVFVLPLQKASEVVKRRTGQCTAKANLTVAMLRAANLPARFHFTDLRKEIIKGLASGLTYEVMPKTIGHAYPEVYLDNKWMKIDPTKDKELCDLMMKKKIGLGAPNLPKPPIDWDGYQDVSPTDPFLVEDFGVHASPEAEIRKSIRRWYTLRGFLWMLSGGWRPSNRNLKKLRKEKP